MKSYAYSRTNERRKHSLFIAIEGTRTRFALDIQAGVGYHLWESVEKIPKDEIFSRAHSG